MKTKNQFVTSLAHLIDLVNEGHEDYALILNAGVFSRKTITYNPKTKKFKVTNHIDDTTVIFTHEQIMDPEYTNIGKAIPLKSLVAIIE